MEQPSYELRRQTSAAHAVQTTMMDVSLRVTDFMHRAERFFARDEIVSRIRPGEYETSNYAQVGEMARRLAAGLEELGLRPGARIATLMWNHAAHVAAYFAIPGIGAVLHTLNPRLTPEQIAYVVADAGDEVVLIDESLLPLWAQVEQFVSVPHVIVNGADPARRSLAELLACDPLPRWPEGPFDENTALSICHTSGTTGNPKGVVYSHRSAMLHSLACGLSSGMDLSGNDVLLILTPMFHVNGWGLPYAGAMTGAKQILPGAQIGPEETLDLIVRESVTKAFGVPTMWTNLLQAIDAHPGRWTLPGNLRLFTGGSAPSVDLLRRFDKLGVELQNGWGMTEMSPSGTRSWLKKAYHAAPYEQQIDIRLTGGIAQPLVDLRIVDDQGTPLPFDGRSRGELQSRGPWVTSGYLGVPTPVGATTPDGWFRTGDVAVIHPDGYLRLVDRLKDLIKSGGEWISSVDMENILLDHPEIVETAVIATADDRWGERPLPVVVQRPGGTMSEMDILAHLAAHYPRWAVPDRVQFTDAIPKTSVGKIDKAALRKCFGGFASV